MSTSWLAGAVWPLTGNPAGPGGSERNTRCTPALLTRLERSVFGHARPRTVLVTTPNAEYNVRYDRLRGGGFRHPDHRFEWTRAEFAGWAEAVANRHGYSVRFDGIGDADAELGPPSQLAVFTRLDVSQSISTKETS